MANRVTSPSGLSVAASIARSNQASPRPKFDVDQIKLYMKALLASTLQGEKWDAKDKERTKRWCKEIGERVKDRMVEIEPRGFKYMVTTQINENLGQGGSGNLVCHWEDSDAVVQEVLVNDSLICVCIAFAIRTV